MTTVSAPNVIGETVAGLIERMQTPWHPAAVVDLLHRNKVPLLSLDLDALPAALVDSAEFQQALEEHRQSYAVQREEYVRVRDAWLQSGIDGMFIKTASIPPSFPYTSDNLDILVHLEQGEEARAILRRLGFLELVNIEEPMKWLFRRFRGGRSISAVHVHHWAGWNLDFFEADLLWSRVRTSPDDPFVLAPSPEDALLINLAHAFYENKCFSLHDLEKMRVNWNSHELDWDYLPEVPRRRGWYDGFLLGMLLAAHMEEALTGVTGIPEQRRQYYEAELRRYGRVYRYYRKLVARPLEMPFRVSFTFSKVLYYYKAWRDTHDSFWPKLKNTVNTLVWGFKLKTGIRPQRSLLVAISGLDGSGKTGQAEALVDVLRLVEIKSSHYWNRVGSGPLTRLLTLIERAVSRRKDSAQPDTARVTGDLAERSGLKQALWTWASVLELAAQYTYHIRLPLLAGKLGLGRVIVSDRYLLDAEAEIRTRIPNPGWAVRLAIAFLGLFSPRPDLSYVLDVPEAVAQQRHDLPVSTEALKVTRDWYAALASETGARVVDGTRDPDEITNEIITAVIARFESTYPTLLNRVLLSNPSQRNPGIS